MSIGILTGTKPPVILLVLYTWTMTYMDKLQGKRILIFQQRGWGINIGHFLAKKLKESGCTLAAFTLKKSTHEFTLGQTEITYDLIINNDTIMADPTGYLGSDTISLTEVCAGLGVDSIWPIVGSLRNFVRSYEDKFYYGFKQNVSDDRIVEYVLAIYKCIKYIFTTFGPELIMAPNFVSLSHIMFHLYAKQRGVNMVTITDSKITGNYIFSLGYNDDTGPFYDRVDNLNQGIETSSNGERAKRYIREFREHFKNPDYINPPSARKPMIKRIRHLLSPFYHSLLWYLKKPVNSIQGLGAIPDYRSPRIIFRDYYAKKRYNTFTEHFAYFPLEKINKFVYFPLQFQPEASIDVLAPYFNNQIETARLVALSLPDDYTLVVKEHPAMVGLRPPSYIQKVARTVNVKLIDYRIPSKMILERAALVVSPNSTTMLEAAFFWKPAIQLGNLGTTLRLPNVFKHTDMTTLPKKIKEVLQTNLKIEVYERRLENYVAAAYDTGFNLKYVHMWEQGGTPEELEQLWAAYQNLFQRILS